MFDNVFMNGADEGLNRMKRQHMCVMLVVSCLGLLWGSGVAAAPNIEFEGGLSVDFGDVKGNTLLEHTFVFTNTGDQVLQIPKVKGG